MPAAARKGIKIALFVVLYILAIRYVRLYSTPMTGEQQVQLVNISSYFGAENAEEFYVMVLLIFDLAVAGIAYKMITSLFKHFCKKTA